MTGTPHWLHLFSTFAAAGPQVRTATLVNFFGRRLRHTIVALDGNTACRERLDPGLDVQWGDPPEQSRGLAGPWRMARCVAASAPDLVLTYNWGAIEGVLGARFAGVHRVVHFEDGFRVDEAQRHKARRVWARRLVLPLASRVIVPSRNLERIALEEWRLPRRKVEYVVNGIDLERFHPGHDSALRRKLSIEESAFLIGTVARLRPEKGLDLLIEAFARIEPKLRERCVLLIAGDGPELASLRARARDCAVESRVRFSGSLPDAAPAYRAMDLFALTSHTEQMPLSVVEAMASGLAIVAADVGDVRTMVAPSNQPWILATRDPAAWAERLAHAARLDVQRSSLGTDNRTTALQRFAFEAMVDRYERIFASL